MMKRFYQLQCPIQHYGWGGVRHREEEPPPFIADLTAVASTPDKPFAEMWLGAHPKAPALVRLSPDISEPLDQLIRKDPRTWLGPRLVARNWHRLPFLLKILDIAHPLSIQAHPDRKTAARLHQLNPERYPDDNHKPEIAVALEPGLKALCGFRPLPDIIADVRQRPPLKAWLEPAGEESITEEGWLQNSYRRLHQLDPRARQRLLEQLQDWLGTRKRLSQHDHCFLQLLRNCPGDRGCLSAYFFNLVNLSAGQALPVKPNQPHAYLHGTAVECMANSDNVVRGGLTAKLVDWQTLLQILDYHTEDAATLEGAETVPGERVYRGQAEEFQVEMLAHDRGFSSIYDSQGEISLLLVLNGSARFETEQWQAAASRGTAWVWPGSLDRTVITFTENNTRIVRARTADPV